jgi:hypothetical protein
VKKIIFWGDGLLAGTTGYADLLAHHLFLHHPKADVSTSIYGGGPVAWQAVVRDTPLHVIGKAPDLVILGFGSTDLAAGVSAENMAQQAQTALTLMLQKTQSRICLLSLISSFLPSEQEREFCHKANLGLRELAGDRVSWIDLDTRVERFLTQHRQSAGEKHSLHLDRERLTPLGKLFLAHHAFHLIPWPDLD